MSAEVRILHTSDLHLDASFRATGVPSARARERCAAHLESFDRCVEEARRADAHLLVIAGDLFEAAYTRPATVRHVAKRLAAWGRPVCIAPGNHDPLNDGSVYGLARWPENVTVFAGRWEAKAFPELGLVVHGRGFTEPVEEARLLEGLSIEATGTHVVVAHGSDTSCRPDRHHPHRPFTPDELEELPAAYVALGHYHGFSILPTRRVRAAYCGSPIPQGFGDEGQHGVVLARLRNGEVRLQLLPVPARRFVTVEVDVSGSDTQAEVLEQLKSALVAGGLREDFVRLRIWGSIAPDLELDQGALGTAVAGLAHEVRLQNETLPEYDLESLAQESTLRGHFVRSLYAQLQGASDVERDVIRSALYMGLDAFSGRSTLR